MSVSMDRDFKNQLARVGIIVQSESTPVATALLVALETAAIAAMDDVLRETYPSDYYDYRGFSREG